MQALTSIGPWLSEVLTSAHGHPGDLLCSAMLEQHAPGPAGCILVSCGEVCCCRENV